LRPALLHRLGGAKPNTQTSPELHVKWLKICRYVIAVALLFELRSTEYSIGHFFVVFCSNFFLIIVMFISVTVAELRPQNKKSRHKSTSLRHPKKHQWAIARHN